MLRDGGRIVNIPTHNTVIPGPGLALYCASKAAPEQFTKVASREFGARGITVNTVPPGTTGTGMLRASNPPEALERATGITAGTCGQPAGTHPAVKSGTHLLAPHPVT
jgi:3-oxoacyl-[acyl-carrier protein] reductase